ncbi:MAG: hypothetical protein GY719_11255 [bacterium]|nr:hypothetical protein [bacterium]
MYSRPTRVGSAGPLLLALLLLGPTGAEAEAEAEDVRALQKEALSDRSPGALIQQRGSTWSLVSDEDGGKLVGRVTWADEDNSNIFEVEAAATLQKGAEEVELLDLDGLAGGDASIKGKWAISGEWEKKEQADGQGSFLDLCDELNPVLDDQVAKERGGCDGRFERIEKESCTYEYLQSLPGEWPIAADKGRSAALQAGCDELAKLNPKLKFHPVDYDLIVIPNPQPEVRYCNRAGLWEAARETDEDLDRAYQAATGELAELEAEKQQLIEELAWLEARFAGESSVEERAAIAAQRHAKSQDIETADQKVAEKKAEQKKLRPASLKSRPDELVSSEGELNPWSWLDGKIGEKVAVVCKSYNQPDRAGQIRTFGNDQTCDTEGIPKAIEAIEERKLRSKYYRDYVSAIPVRVWFLTFSAGATNRDFKYLDPSAIPAVATFTEVGALIKSESELDTSIGVSWSAQMGNHFLRFGYEYRNKYNGGSSAELCAPLETGGDVTRCFDTTAGAPTKIDQNVGMLEWRRYLTGNLGLRFQAFYIDEDFRRNMAVENEWEFHALLYFLRNKEQGLNGGLDIAHDTFFDKTTARVFIGQSFNIFD